MAQAYKILGQSAPTSTSTITLYTCPSSTETIVSVVMACNRSSTPTSIRVGIDDNGGGDGNSDYIAYDLPIGANETLELGRGAVLNATDLLRVSCGLTTVTFSAFGVEIT